MRVPKFINLMELTSSVMILFPGAVILYTNSASPIYDNGYKSVDSCFISDVAVSDVTGTGAEAEKILNTCNLLKVKG